MAAPLTCWSCRNYLARGRDCPADADYPYPGVACAGFEYEPGSDEAERMARTAGPDGWAPTDRPSDSARRSLRRA